MKDLSGEAEDMEGVKPCPFCGETEMIEPVIYENSQRGFTTIKIRCAVCCSTGGPIILRWPILGEDEEKGIQKAWDRWNARCEDGM